MKVSFGLTNGTSGFLYGTIYGSDWNETGWVCDDYFDEVAAKAVCNSLNGSYFHHATYQYVTDEYDDFVVDDLVCRGTENITSQCDWTWWHNCWGKEGIYLDCGGPRDWNPGPVSFNLTHGEHGVLWTTIFNYIGQKKSGWVCDSG